jgi:cytochrome o ubiquinol oxidase operon protein cyoD
MSAHKTPQVSHFEPPVATMRSYVIGFLSCIALTIVAYIVATSDVISNNAALLLIAALAIVQCVVQLTRFLHLDHEFKPRWKLLVFIVMLVIVLIIVIGSWWIMDNLNYRMLHSSGQMQEYVESQDGL